MTFFCIHRRLQRRFLENWWIFVRKTMRSKRQRPPPLNGDDAGFRLHDECRFQWGTCPPKSAAEGNWEEFRMMDSVARNLPAGSGTSA